MEDLVVAMGYLDDNWHSMRAHATALGARLGGNTYAPHLGHHPTLMDRRWRFGRDLKGDRLLLVDHSYGDVVLRIAQRFRQTVVVVHDLAFWRERTLLNGAVRHLIVQGLKRATAVVAASQATADALRSELAIQPIAIIHPGADTLLFAHAANARTAHRILHVGSCIERKGIDRLLRLLAALPATYHLLQVGGTFDSAHLSLIEELRLGAQVRQMRDAKAAEIVAAYRDAALLIQPSRYEGFAMTPLEARLAGTRVLCQQGLPVLECLANDGGTIALDFSPFDGGASDMAMTGQRAAVVDAVLAMPADPAVLADREHYGWDRAGAAYAAVFNKLSTVRSTAKSSR